MSNTKEQTLGVIQINGKNETEEVNILHISDLHFGVGKTAREKNNYRKQRKAMILSLIEELRKYRNEIGQWKPDIVVVSGDIAYTGKREEYQEYIEDFYEVIRDPQIGFGLDADCIVESPGNHDLMRENTIIHNYGSKKELFIRPNKLKDGDSIGSELSLVSEYGLGSLSRDNIGSDINEPLMSFFHDFIVSRCEGDPEKIVRLQTPQKWPWIRFVVLNSAWDCRGKTNESIDDRVENDEGRLRVGVSFLEDLLPPLDEIKKQEVIYCAVFHHPFLELTVDDGKGGKIKQNWLAASEQYPIHEGETCFVDKVKNLKCIMNGHVHTTIKPEYKGNDSQTGFWSVCGSLISNDTSLYHCRVIKIFKNGGIYYLDLENSFRGASEADPWKISCKPGNDIDQQLRNKAEKREKEMKLESYIRDLSKRFGELNEQERNQIFSKIISLMMSEAIYDQEYIYTIIEFFIKDVVPTKNEFVKKRKKDV